MIALSEQLVKAVTTHRFPFRTPLFPLVPKGAGSPLVESLTGYIARLACEHCLLISDFLDVPCLMFDDSASQDPRTRRRVFHASCYQIDGAASVSERWIGALEEATGVSGLRDHTILPFVILSKESWLRAWRAWCPDCYEEYREDGLPAYDPLLWCIKAASICSKHLRLLEDRCPACRRRSRPLANGYIVGHCPGCRSWLGTSGKVRPIREPDRVSDPFLMWSSSQIGTLLAAVPEMQGNLHRQPLQDVLRYTLELIPLGQQETLFSALRITRRSLNTWARGEVHPRLAGLCRLSFSLQLPLLDLISGELTRIDLEKSFQALCEGTSASMPTSRSTGRKDAVDLPYEKTLELVIQAPKEIPPPTVHALALRLGYVSATTLQRRHPRECDNLREARAAWLCEKQSKLRQALEAALIADVPRSVKQICRDCCVREETVSARFHDLKENLRVRYIDWLKLERKRKEGEFECSVNTAIEVLRSERKYPSVGSVIVVNPSLKSAGWEKLTHAIRKAMNEVPREGGDLNRSEILS